MKHEVLSHSEFFKHMDDFGYFRDLEGELPDEFTAVFEIARVLEDERSSLFQSISAAMTVTTPDRNDEEEIKLNKREWRPNFNIPNGEEYEAELMRSVSDIKRIFPHQYLLPDDVFMRKLAQRSLWINVPRTPVIIPFKSSDSDYAPNNFKQKVYVLLDTSTSMSSHHRFQMAKAVTYVFLKRNLKELGHIYFRTFDVDLGALQTATDIQGFQRLIRYVMRLNRLGNGTVMEKAILQAAEDIRSQDSLSDAEILIVTDGACHLDIDRVREALGKSIVINTIKIGNAQIFADDKMLRDSASRGSLPRQRDLAKLEEQIRRLKHDLRSASADRDRHVLERQLSGLEARAEELRSGIVVKLRERYGREIEQLSRVFVNIDDISSDAIFELRESEIAEMRELLAEVEEDFREGIDADSLREAALLYEHIQLLLKMATNEAQREQLSEMERKLSELLEGLIESGQHNPVNSMQGISRNDLNDLNMMLHTGSGRGNSLIALLLALIKKLMRLRLFSRKH